MKRNTFLKTSSLMAFSLTAFGKVRWNGERYEGDTPTTTDILGPFYRPGSPVRQRIVPPDSKGIPMLLKGTVFKPDGKTPLGGALIEVWQCDEKENYDNTSDDYKFRGAWKTAADGKYKFETIVPIPYKVTDTMWRPAHVHFRVSTADYQDLITQIYFKGDPYLEEDTSAASPESQSRILEILKNKSGNHEVKFDILMQKEFALEAAAVKKLTGLYQLEQGIAEFFMEDDLLFLKLNGQLMDALTYKGDNTFEGGLGYVKAKFNLLPQVSQVLITKGDYDSNDPNKITTIKGDRFLKY